jgi:hypothetical protein
MKVLAGTFAALVLEPISKSRNMYKTGKIHVCYA